jgi:hypothetical protein
MSVLAGADERVVALRRWIDSFVSQHPTNDIHVTVGARVTEGRLVADGRIDTWIGEQKFHDFRKTVVTGVLYGEGEVRVMGGNIFGLEEREGNFVLAALDGDEKGHGQVHPLHLHQLLDDLQVASLRRDSDSVTVAIARVNS